MKVVLEEIKTTDDLADALYKNISIWFYNL